MIGRRCKIITFENVDEAEQEKSPNEFGRVSDNYFDYLHCHRAIESCIGLSAKSKIYI